MTFTCPHFDPAEEFCLLLGKDCVPGRPGCVLRRKSVFAIPVEERIREAEERRRARDRPGAGPRFSGRTTPPGAGAGAPHRSEPD